MRGIDRIAGEPLVHFLLLGLGLFLLYGIVQESAPAPLDEIVIDQPTLAELTELWRRDKGRSPTVAETTVLIEAYVRDEISVREARALRLDRGDPVIRSHLRQKLEALAVGDVSDVGDEREAARRARIDAYYADLRQRYRVVRELPGSPSP